MPKKMEYRILPQGERDDFHSHIRNTTTSVHGRVTPQYFCLFLLILVVILLILGGVATLTASMFYSKDVTTTFGRFWFDYSSESTASTPINPTNESAMGYSSKIEGDHGDLKKTTMSLKHNKNSSDDEDKNKPLHESNKVHHHHYHTHLNQSTVNNASGIYSDSGESELHNLSNSTDSFNSEEEDSDLESSGHQVTHENEMQDLKEKIAEAVRDLEKGMENVTGIRKAEFVVPIFMLISFLLLFSMVSLCCCMLMKRKDKRRRKLFGKLITDLQTGDSKTVLLNNMDLDD